MSKFDLKQKAFILRKQGKSIKQIAEDLNISKSTVSLWCQNLVLSQKEKDMIFERMKLLNRQGCLKGADTNKRKKIDAQASAKVIAKEMLGKISERDQLIAGIALYWAEGSKADSTTGFIFVNSDPLMIRFMYNWLLNILKIKKVDIYAKVSINNIHKSRIEEVLSFWSDLLDLPRDQFSNTFL